MTEKTVFTVPKVTGTHAEVLTAVGLADLLQGMTDGIVLVRDEGSHFQVEADFALSEDRLRNLPQSAGYPFLKANEKVEIPRSVTNVVDYKAEKARVDRLKKVAAPKSRRGRGRDVLGAAVAEMVEQDLPRDDWRLLQALNTLQGDDISNKIHARIVTSEPDKFRSEVLAALERMREGKDSGLDWEASSVQIFTPSLAKGYARLKPDSTDRNDRTKEQWADPFADWLKFRGYFGIACPFFTGNKRENVRLLVPVPARITIGALTQTAVALRKAKVFGGPPKIDALAVLELAEILVKHSEEYHQQDVRPYPGMRLMGKRLDEIVSSLMVTHYQSLGNARAVSSIATLSLPGWFAISSREDAVEMLEAISEHRAVIRGLRDDHSDEIGLLIQYRRFLEKRGEGAAWSLIEFLEQYGAFWMRTFGLREDGRERRPRRFTDRLIRRILEGNMERLSEILENKGFKAIAAAVRKSTVSAQARKVMGKKDHRQIQYDLLHQIRQKCKLSAPEFIEVVSDFVVRYNAENARIREINGNLRAAPPNITDQEFAEFVSLFDRGWKPSLVGAMLAAFGSCREERGEDAEDVAAGEGSVNSGEPVNNEV